jgi:hypothetical protein
MNRIFFIAALSVAVFASTSSAKEIAVMIDLNGKGGQCTYRIEYTSRGNFRDKTGTTPKTTGVSCILHAKAIDSTKLLAKIDSVHIKSTLYDDAKIEDISEKLLKTDFSVKLDKGSPTIDTAAKIPVSDYIAWDLYRQLVKMLPMLPDKPIKPGYTWENVAVIPLQTQVGTVPCELYRFYTFKKMKGDTATIVWNFRFVPTNNYKETTNILEDVPIGGNGSGSALIDVRNKQLVSADMGFSTPVATVDGISVTWQERAVFTVKRCQ